MNLRNRFCLYAWIFSISDGLLVLYCGLSKWDIPKPNGLQSLWNCIWTRLIWSSSLGDAIAQLISWRLFMSIRWLTWDHFLLFSKKRYCLLSVCLLFRDENSKNELVLPMFTYVFIINRCYMINHNTILISLRRI